MEQKLRLCPGCKAEFPIQEGIEHYQTVGIARYGIASPECSYAYCEILNFEREHFGYPPPHRFSIVDAYAVQHPPHLEYQKELGINQRLIDASIQSVAVHLIALYMALEKNSELSEVAKVMDTILSKGVVFPKLKPPESLGKIRAIDVAQVLKEKDLTLEEYRKLAEQWALSTWNAWKEHHETVKQWYEKYSK